MFCPSCGSEYTIELKYCNRCGANLNFALTEPSEVAAVNLTKPALIIGATILFLTLGGLFSVISGVITLSTRVGGGDLPMAIVFFGMLSILTVDIFLMRLLSKLVMAAISPGKISGQRKLPKSTNELRLPSSSTARLEPAPSVTENTTRFFEPYRSPTEAEVLNPPRRVKQ